MFMRDYNTGRIWALETDSSNPENRLLFDTSHRITAFGVDNQQAALLLQH